MHTAIEGHRLRSRFSRSSFVSDFSLTTEQLSELHDPKSLAAFVRIFGSEGALYKYLKTDKQSGCAFGDEDPHNTNRYKTYGDNRIPERSSKSFFKLVLEAMQDQTMILLSIAAVISFALGLYETLGQPPEYENGVKIPQVDWVEGVAIMIAVLVVVGVGAANDYQKERRFVMLNRKKEDREVTVTRNGIEQLISIHDLMVGDLLSLQTGEVVPADCILVYGSCECDESALTGESDTIKKVDLNTALERYNELTNISANIDIGVRGPNGEKAPDPMLISGSKLLSGLGQAVVTNVGVNSMHGRTMMSLKIEPEATPLQARLNSLADSISIYGSVIGLLLFLILFIRFLSYLPKGRKFHSLKPAQKGSRFMDIFITAVTVIVVAVPEGLPLAVTLALAFATTRMTKDGNLVRVLRACETMGSATAVCSDKTGTLTQNRMTVVKGVFGSSEFNDVVGIRSNSFYPSKENVAHELSDRLKLDILRNICLNSTAFENKNPASNTQKTNLVEETVKSIWNKKKKMKDRAEKPEEHQLPAEPFIGSKTETALLSMVKEAFGMNDLQFLRDNTEELGIISIVQVIPFESSRKWGGIVTKLFDGTYRLYVKGAAELLLKRCSYRANSDGQVTKISAGLYQEAAEKIKEMAGDALRTISLVHKDLGNSDLWPPAQLKDPSNPSAASPDLLFGDELYLTAEGMPVITTNDNIGFTLDSIVGIQDPLRPGVRESVEQCKRSGVTVRMVTGDNYLTAQAIAINCGILTEEDLKNPDCAMEGPVFRKLSKQQQRAVIPNLRVLARSSSNDKRILVDMLKKMGELVAVTGDGTNDAPALTLADVGFSMGIAGTEVAREASDIILMKDDFTAIVNAIKWGRCVSISIKKFIQFQLTVNITAVILTFVTAVFSGDEGSVFTAVQLLWVNLIMDTLAALALATDKPDNNILDRKPNGRTSPLISVSTWKMILGQSLLQLIVIFTLHLAGGSIFFPNSGTLNSHQKQQLHALSFNTFVWLQFFKLIVSRKLDEADGISDWRARITASNLNFFQDITRNYYFLLILAVVGILQVVIMYVGGAAFSIARQTRAMWAVAIICGMLSLPVGALIRICPDEWTIAIFPARLFNILKYVIGLEFLRRGKKTEDEESLLIEGEPNHYQLIGLSAFERAKSDVLFHKEHFKDHEISYLNPLSIIKRWSSSKESDSPYSDDEHSLIASLTMVPTLVGGAVGGFSQMSDCVAEKKRSSSQFSTKSKD